MPIRTSGGVFNAEMLTGSLAHYVVCGADFSGAVNSYGKPVPFSAAEIIFNKIESGAYINIMNPNEYNLSFALEEDRSIWDEVSLTEMVQSLGPDVGVDHIDCTVCTVKSVPYIWGCGTGGATTFLDLTDTPNSYAGAAGYSVVVDPAENGLIFVPSAASAFSIIEVPSQPTINAVGGDTLTFVAGPNVVITTNALLKTVQIESIGGGSNDYIPVPPGTSLMISSKYFVTAGGTVTLPAIAGFTAGQSVTVTKPNGSTLFVNIGSLADIISTDLGPTDSIEMDSTEEAVFICNGAGTWNLQIGSRL